MHTAGEGLSHSLGHEAMLREPLTPPPCLSSATLISQRPLGSFQLVYIPPCCSLGCRVTLNPKNPFTCPPAAVFPRSSPAVGAAIASAYTQYGSCVHGAPCTLALLVRPYRGYGLMLDYLTDIGPPLSFIIRSRRPDSYLE